MSAVSSSSFDDLTPVPSIPTTDRPNFIAGFAAAADYLGVPAVRVQKWCKEGRLPHSKVTAKTPIFDERDLLAFVAAARVEATMPPPLPRNTPKSPEHRAAIAAGQARAWERRRAAKATGSKGRPS